jgi:hypothetical protein
MMITPEQEHEIVKRRKRADRSLRSGKRGGYNTLREFDPEFAKLPIDIRYERIIRMMKIEERKIKKAQDRLHELAKARRGVAREAKKKGVRLRYAYDGSGAVDVTIEVGDDMDGK